MTPPEQREKSEATTQPGTHYVMSDELEERIDERLGEIKSRLERAEEVRTKVTWTVMTALFLNIGSILAIGVWVGSMSNRVESLERVDVMRQEHSSQIAQNRIMAENNRDLLMEFRRDVRQLVSRVDALLDRMQD